MIHAECKTLQTTILWAQSYMKCVSVVAAYGTKITHYVDSEIPQTILLTLRHVDLKVYSFCVKEKKNSVSFVPVFF